MSINLADIIRDIINAISGRGKSPVSPPASPLPPAPVVIEPMDGQPPEITPAPPLPPPPVANIPTGSGFIKENINLIGAVREANILKEFQLQHIPSFMNQLSTVSVTIGPNTILYMVTPDFLCVGNNSDYVRVPMNPHTAQSIADMYGFSLITRKMSNDIWKQAVNKLPPRPWGPPYDQDMERTHRIGTHSQTIQNQLISSGMNPFALTSGHKKDVVLTNRLAPNNPNRRVAIYGWHQPNGQPIQGLNPSSHGDLYADYSHGIRLVNNNVLVNNQPMKIQEVFSHPVYSALVSDEGPLRFLRY